MKDLTILMAEDDLGHAGLILRNLQRAGLTNKIIHFENGKEVVDYLFMRGEGPKREEHKPYLLLLDINMPVMNGIEVLQILKNNNELKSMPIIMLTTTDNPFEVRRCYDLGCNNYIVKPVEYKTFAEVLSSLGIFLKFLNIPELCNVIP